MSDDKMREALEALALELKRIATNNEAIWNDMKQPEEDRQVSLNRYAAYDDCANRIAQVLNEQAAQRRGRGPVTGPFHQMHSEVRHTDDEAVERFAAAMKAKLSDARGKGRGGWDDPGQCAEEFLVMLFGQHLAKANQWNWVDLANFCMMLHERHVDPSYASSAVAVAADTLYGTGWEGRAQRQGGEAVAWPCWACKKPVSIDQKRENDGDCPHCGSELDEDLWPQQPAPQPAVPEVIQAAEQVITNTCQDAVDKLNEIAPHMGWDSGDTNARIRIRELHNKLAHQPQPDWTPFSADTERLDWLDQRREDCVQEGSDGEPELYAHAWGIYEQAGSIREAIDMNMERPEPPEDAGND